MTLATKADHDLPICPKCGWAMAGPHEIETHRTCKLVAAGKSATTLAARFPKLASTKFGYGGESLTFEVDDDLHLTLQCSNKTFQLQDLWLLGNLTADEAAGLVKAIATWRSNCTPARGKKKQK